MKTALVDCLAARNALTLAWSATLAKVNKTFLSAEGRAESRGGSSIFSIYRYKVAKHPIELPVWEVFRDRAFNVFEAKVEIDRVIETKGLASSGWQGKFECYSCDVEDLADRFAGKADYIFTDSPYGGYISYIDLSTLWNAWLGQLPANAVKERELIVGGELRLSEQAYIDRLGGSIRACTRMLKRDRWLSVVFQHWNVAYFEAILSSAAQNGAHLRAAVSQVGDPIWSMHKKKGAASVLGGELILTFYKGMRETNPLNTSGFDVAERMGDILAKTNESMVYGEQIFN